METHEAADPAVRSRFVLVGSASLAIVVVAGAAWLFTGRSKPDTGKAPDADKATAAPVTDTRPSPTVESLDSLIPRKRLDTKPEEPPPPPKKDPEKAYASTDTSKTWSVVAATHNSYESAEKRAEVLKGQWKGCDCTVFPRGESEKYFVVVGTDLDRNSADRLRDRATEAGLPSDTYVTKLIRREEDER